ncbi:MAG: MBL fold metallo-hydrolase [Leptolinea sp.]|jgi:7,8-dihydropterin-6-yl-methyl-4-(beta-D-ribofuranosyl)aminobenzene 5'-phosphate synthase|nr:MBL fold metallo-hydrolase [Leptolinea sp.]
MLEISCLVDNTAQQGSPFWAEHGLAFVIKTPDRQILFDTGQSGVVLEHNAALMGIELNRTDALVLSHAHFDHTGGLERLMTHVFPGLPLFANADFFQERFHTVNGQPESIGIPISREKITNFFDIHLEKMPAGVVPGIWTTGEITDRSEFEGRSKHHVIRSKGEWQPDPYLDDLSLVLDTREGLILLCGCCHAGLLNTLAHVQKIFNRPVKTIIGGTHLISASTENLKHSIDILNKYDEIQLFPNHCTGEQARLTLISALGGRVHSCPAGTVLKFE